MSRRAQLGWTTTGHTATDVALYAQGPGAVRLVGHHDNAQIGRILGQMMGADLSRAGGVVSGAGG